MMIFTFIVSFWSFFFATNENAHPIHISVTEINYNEKSKSLQIISRIFIDELELGVRAQLKNQDIDLLKDSLKAKELAKNYFGVHFKVKIDGKPVKINYLGFEKEDISIVSYIEIESVKKLKTIEVYNDMIMEIHEDQSNLVHVTYKSPVKSVRLTRDNPSEVFSFDVKK